MIDTYSGLNMIVEEDLLVKYRVEAKTSTTSTFTRYATKRYKYIGMSQTAAASCLTAKIAQYTRQYWIVGTSGSTAYKMLLGANISSRHSGEMWEVSISVNETDCCQAATGTAPATVFASIESRSYDTFSSLTLDSATLSGYTVTFTYTQAIPVFSAGQLMMRYHSIGETEWRTASASGGTAELTGNPPFVVQLIYKGIESNVLTAS